MLSVGAWPQPDYIELYVVFDGLTGLTNIATREPVTHTYGFDRLVTERLGPFDMRSAAYSVSYTDYLSRYDNMSPMKIRFSVSFYFQTPANVASGILMVSPIPDILRFSVVANQSHLEIHSHQPWPRGYQEESRQVAIAGGMFSSHRWTFVAFTYDGFEEQLLIYNDIGEVVERRDEFSMDLGGIQRLWVGEGWRNGKRLTMDLSTAISCLSVHGTVLTPAEIRLLPCTCEMKGKAVSV